MSKQRFRLADYYQNGSNYYHATFEKLTHKTNAQHKKIPVALLTDVYLVDENDKKVRLSKKNDFVDRKGRHIIADHIWVKFTKPWFEVPNELIKGDEIFFSAEVEQYKINRPDVLKQRDRIWNDAKKKADQIYKRWSKYTDEHKRKNFQLSLEKMKQKQHDTLEQAKEDQKKLELVDYGLNKIKKINISKLVKPRHHFERGQYNYEQYKRQGYKYSAWLAARSIKYSQGKSVE